MNIAITGANGFIAKNLIFNFKLLNDCNLFTITRSTPKKRIDFILRNSDIIYHLAGVNRPKINKTFKKDNYQFTKYICNFIKREKLNKKIIFTSSIQIKNKNKYGSSKKECEKLLFELSKNNNSKIVILRLPNIFGKWSKPNYNSVISTFCHNIARDKKINISSLRNTIELLYIDDLVEEFLKIKDKNLAKLKIVSKFKNVKKINLKNLSELIYNFHNSRKNLYSINFKNKFVKNLYSTYISFLPKKNFSYNLKLKKDNRGSFMEFLKTKNNGQFSIFVAKKNKIRGHHFHHSKVEKFLVLKGSAKFKMQNISNNKLFELDLKGSLPKVVETIPGWQHYIKNVGSKDLIVLLWSNEVFDVNKPDTFKLNL